MNRLLPRAGRWAVLIVAAASAAGCMTVNDSAQIRSQATQVADAISGGMSEHQLTEADLIATVEEDGKGYVTAITRSGSVTKGTIRTVVHTVLGAAELLGSGRDPIVLCFRFTVGYEPYQVWQTQESCPRARPASPFGYEPTAMTEYTRLRTAENAPYELPTAAQAQVAVAPTSRSQAVRLLGLNWRARRKAGLLPITASEFAAAHGRAGLALRLRRGGCVYLSPPDDPDGNGLPGPWLSPVHAACTGAAALAASGWISTNPAAGG